MQNRQEIKGAELLVGREREVGEERRINKDIDEERLINKVNDEKRYGWRGRERAPAGGKERKWKD